MCCGICLSLVESSGIWWSPVESGGIWWNPVESGGIWWSPVESAGVRWSLVESSGIHWNPLESGGIWWSLVESAGICWNLLDRSTGLCLVRFCRFRRNPVISGGFQQTPPTGHGNLAHVTLTKSGTWVHQIPLDSARICWNPADHVGECTLLVQDTSDMSYSMLTIIYIDYMYGIRMD